MKKNLSNGSEPTLSTAKLTNSNSMFSIRPADILHDVTLLPSQTNDRLKITAVIDYFITSSHRNIKQKINCEIQHRPSPNM